MNPNMKLACLGAISMMLLGCDSEAPAPAVTAKPPVENHGRWLDVMGMKLGDTIEDENACSSPPKVQHIADESDIPALYTIECNRDGKVSATYSHDGILVSVLRVKEFAKGSDWNIIKQRIIEKYGAAKMSTDLHWQNALCWGACKPSGDGRISADWGG